MKGSIYDLYVQRSSHLPGKLCPFDNSFQQESMHTSVMEKQKEKRKEISHPSFRNPIVALLMTAVMPLAIDLSHPIHLLPSRQTDTNRNAP